MQISLILPCQINWVFEKVQPEAWKHSTWALFSKSLSLDCPLYALNLDQYMPGQSLSRIFLFFYFVNTLCLAVPTLQSFFVECPIENRVSPISQIGKLWPTIPITRNGKCPPVTVAVCFNRDWWPSIQSNLWSAIRIKCDSHIEFGNTKYDC